MHHLIQLSVYMLSLIGPVLTQTTDYTQYVRPVSVRPLTELAGSN